MRWDGRCPKSTAAWLWAAGLAAVVVVVAWNAKSLPPQRKISIDVFAWRRVASLERLLRSLAAADPPPAPGRVIPMTIHLDAGYADEAAEAARAFTWPFGPKKVQIARHRTPNDAALESGARLEFLPLHLGLENASHSKDFHLLFEDDCEASPGYLAYTDWCLDTTANDERIVGCSLSAPRVDEQSPGPPPAKPWAPETHLAAPWRTQPALLMQAPASWGAVYPAWVLAELQGYLLERTLGNLAAPPIKGPPQFAAWTASWKRYLCELFAVRGWTLVYPNLPDGRSWAATHAVPGVHDAPASDTAYLERLLAPERQRLLGGPPGGAAVALVAADAVAVALERLAAAPLWCHWAVVDLFYHQVLHASPSSCPARDALASLQL